RSSVKMPRILFRVVWGLSDMIATFLPTTWFISVDFPTLGRPISATNPDLWLMLEFLPAEGVGQQLFHGGFLPISLQIGQVHLHVRRAQLRHHLAAGPAGGDGTGCVGDDRQGRKAAFALGNGFEQGGSFRTVGQSVGGVLHIAPPEHRPVVGQKGGPHRKAGAGNVGVLPRPARFGKQHLFHGPTSPCLLILRRTPDESSGATVGPSVRSPCPFGGGPTTPPEMMYFSPSSTVLSRKITSFSGTSTSQPAVGLGVVGRKMLRTFSPDRRRISSLLSPV